MDGRRASAGDIESVVKEHGLKRVILIGHSMGGPVALVAAKRMPGVVVAVIGVDTLQNAEFEFPEEQAKQFFDAFEKDFKGSLGMFLPGMLPEKVDPELKKWILTRAEKQDQKMAIGLMRDMSKRTRRQLMKEAKVPVRGINSAGGFQFHMPTEVEINKKYADFKAVTIEGRRPLPDAGEAEGVQREAAGDAEGVCFEEITSATATTFLPEAPRSWVCSISSFRSMMRSANG